jgi:hypothetical protein
MKVFVLIRKTIKWIFLVLLTLIVILVLINAFDEKLKPEAQAALDWQSPAKILDDNGYIILLGLDAPANEDAKQAGIKRYQEELARYQATQASHTEPLVSELNPPSDFVDEQWKVYRCDYKQQKSCVDFYRHFKAQELSEFYAAQQLLETRFNAIKQSKQYVEAMPPMLSAYMPSYSSLTSASELARMKAVRLIASGQVSEGIATYTENAMFSRYLMKNASNLVSRMVGVAMAQKDIRVLSELLVQYPAIAVDYATQLAPVTTSITSPEFSFSKPFQSERNMMLQGMAQLPFEISKQANSFGKLMAKLFFQPNATVNLFYNWWQLTLDASLASPRKSVAHSALEAQQRALLGWGYAPYYIKNPVAKILVSVAQPDYEKYVERQYDLEGYIQLVSLQLGMTKLHASHESTEVRVNALLNQHLNPYTGKPMQYDASQYQISFEGKQVSAVSYGKNSYQITLTH